MRLNIPSGNAVRFEPGEAKEVELVELGGAWKVIGINNLVNGRYHRSRCESRSHSQSSFPSILNPSNYEPVHQQNKICK